MKWGVRRYQKSNGSLTSAGKGRYKNIDSGSKKKKSISSKKKYYRKSVLKLYGGIAVGAGLAFYINHKHQIDSFIASKMAHLLYKTSTPNGFKYSSFKPESSSVIDVPFREINR